jgi:hypothetical protein
MVLIPHPAWVWCAALLGILPAAYGGARLAGRTETPRHPAAATTQVP